MAPVSQWVRSTRGRSNRGRAMPRRPAAPRPRSPDRDAIYDDEPIVPPGPIYNQTSSPDLSEDDTSSAGNSPGPASEAGDLGDALPTSVVVDDEVDATLVARTDSLDEPGTDNENVTRASTPRNDDRNAEVVEQEPKVQEEKKADKPGKKRSSPREKRRRDQRAPSPPDDFETPKRSRTA